MFSGILAPPGQGQVFDLAVLAFLDVFIRR
jgi:hypothetical protein